MTIISSSSPLHYESPVKKKKLYNYKPIIHRVSCRAKEIKKNNKRTERAYFLHDIAEEPGCYYSSYYLSFCTVTNQHTLLDLNALKCINTGQGFPSLLL